jgi:glycosyltransferase involved in cell wall biosynthesis
MLSENLSRAGADTEVYATTANGKKELPVIPGKRIIVDGVQVTYFARITKDHSHFSPTLLKKLWKEVKSFDLVHIHAWWNLVSIFACLIALKRKVPVLLSARGTLSPYSFTNNKIGVKWIVHHMLGKPLLTKCYFHATSEREKEAINDLLHPKSITILPNFVKLPYERPSGQATPSPFFKLLFFSRIEEKKGLDLLLSALANINAPYHLTIAGDGDESYISSLKKLAAENRLEDKIDWIGFQTENKFRLLQAHDLFVLPSYDENFGNTVIESLSVGTPVLISEQVGLAGYVRENGFGWVCQTSPASIAWNINNIVINGQDDLVKIRKTAPDIIFGDFKEENLVKKYISLYKELIRK